jgi:hypothetical protein
MSRHPHPQPPRRIHGYEVETLPRYEPRAADGRSAQHEPRPPTPAAAAAAAPPPRLLLVALGMAGTALLLSVLALARSIGWL